MSFLLLEDFAGFFIFFEIFSLIFFFRDWWYVVWWLRIRSSAPGLFPMDALVKVGKNAEDVKMSFEVFDEHGFSSFFFFFKVFVEVFYGFSMVF